MMKVIHLLAILALATVVYGNPTPSILLRQPEICIDSTIQPIVAEMASLPIESRNPDWVCAVLINKEGKVVALFDTDSTFMHVKQKRQLGNIIEPFTLLGALLTRKVDRNTTFHIAKGGIKTESHHIQDPYPLDTTFRVRDILAFNSPVGMYKIYEKAYSGNPSAPHIFNTYIRQLGIESNVKNLQDLLSQSYLNKFRVSPLHLAWLYHCMAHDLLPQEWKSVAPFVRDGLHDVVWHNGFGTASRTAWTRGAQSDKVRIVGKTGAVQIGPGPKNRILSFCGYFPEESPEYTCLIIVANPTFPHNASMDCAVPVRKIAERIYQQ